MKKIFLIILSIFLFFGCKQKMENSFENLDWFFEQNEFEIIKLSYYGLEVKGESRIKFEKMKDSIWIETDYFSRITQERKISFSDFDEVNKNLKCLIGSKPDGIFKTDIYPSRVDYIWRKNNKELKLFDTSFKCDLEKVFRINLNFPNLLDRKTASKKQ